MGAPWENRNLTLFHIFVRVIPDHKFTDEDILKRYVDFYGDEHIFADGLVSSLRLKLSNLSEFMREIKVNIARFYNRRGFFGGDRFKSVIVEKGNVKVIEDRVLEKERSKEFELSKADRFRYRTRYFTDSGIIGSKEFVSTNYQRFKNLFESKHEKKPKPIKGLDGIYSLKRLSEVLWRAECASRFKIACHKFSIFEIIFQPGFMPVTVIRHFKQ